MKRLVPFSGKEQKMRPSQKAMMPRNESTSEFYEHFRTEPMQQFHASIFQWLKAGLLVLALFLFGATQSIAQVYDLNLSQSVDKDSVGIGDMVTFTLTVNHEAGDLATGIVVTDSVSGGLTNIVVGTPTNGGTASFDSGTGKITWDLADISTGSTSLSFTGEVTGEGIYFNIAEITTSPSDSDSEADNQNYLEDDIAAACVSVPIKLCTATQDSVLVVAPTDATNVQWYRIYDFGGDGNIGAGDTMALSAGNSISLDSVGTYYFTADLGSCQAGNCCPVMIEPACMDLALTKMLTTTGTIIPGDTVEFLVKVYNQGDIYTDSIQLYDYLPDILNLVVENGWTLTGTGDTTATKLLTVADSDLMAGGLAPMDSVSVAVRAVIPLDFKGTSLVNYAEIGNQTDIYGKDLTDSDSKDDTDRTNDTGGEAGGITDNVTNNSNSDEDDHDPALVTVEQVFDLALRKTLAAGQSVNVNPGDTISFQIWVYNQGTQPAYNLNLVDYSPVDSLVINNGYSINWIDVGSSAALFFAGPIAAGDSMSTTISYYIPLDFMGTSLTNNAEITSADNDTNGGNTPPTDIDSSPDAVNGETNAVNDEITGDAKNNVNEDEDDHDFESVTLTQTYDLALTKIVAEAGPFAAGDTVTFSITVYNQGTLDASNIEVTDSLPTNLTLSGLDRNNWTSVSSSIATNNISSLAAGADTTLLIDAVIDASFMGTSLSNNAMITADDGDDIDSDPTMTHTPDDYADNDSTTETDGGDDEDPAQINIGQVYDLALTKVLVDKGTPYSAGDTATFRIYVYNQGTVTAAANTIKVKDYIPSDMILADAAWAAADSSYTFPNAIAANSLDSVDISLQIAPSFMGTSITNNAEIVEDGGDDADSTPGSEANGNAPDSNDNDVAATDGSDDYDPAEVRVGQFFDLALIETLAPGQASTVSPGETVDIKVKITNQGTINADFIEITQYFPAGATLNAANAMNWIALNDSTAQILLSVGNGRLPVGGLAPDSMVMLTLQVVLDPNSPANEFVFNAEISEDGINDDHDSTPDDNRTNDAGGDVNTATDDIVDQIAPVDEDDEDPTMVTVEFFDLALTNELVTTGDVMPGDSITTKIKIFNQGDVPADSIRIYAYIPEGLELDDPNWIVLNDSVAYTVLTVADGELPTGGLLADSMTMVTIGFNIEPTFMGSILLVNAEIGSATDENGNPVTDIDSTPDGSNDDVVGADNVIDGTNNDEDDHDPVFVNVTQIFDLALIETLAPGQANVVRPGETVDIKVKVTNQGTLNAETIELTQYLPAGVTLNAANAMGWTALNDSTAQILLTVGNGLLPTGGLAPDSMVMLTLQVVLDANVTAAEFVFHAEISDDGSGNDIDSTPDDDRLNDTGGDVNTATDDIIDQTPPTDEDDEDPTMVTVEYFDLALTTEILTASPIAVWDSVTAKIKVTNQGDIPADSIRVYAYLPDGLMLDDPNWIVVNDSTVYTVLTVADGALPVGGLQADEMTMVTIGLAIDPLFIGSELVIIAEIGAATDNNGNPVTDQDSTPNGVNEDTIGGDNITDNSSNDEDDHDPATITLGHTFDLALKKTLAAGQNTTVSPGDTVNYLITVYNQGSLTAEGIQLVDYLATDLEFINIPSINPNWFQFGGSNPGYIINTPLAAGDSISVPVSFRVNPSFTGMSLTNTAEIAAADNDGNEGTAAPTDNDSNPDSLPGDDFGGNDLIDSSNGDEDDHDSEPITVRQPFDLALTKVLVDKGSAYRINDTVTFRIYIHNQGVINATSITVKDIIPSGLILADANWNADSTYTFTSGLVAGAMDSVDIALQIAHDFSGNSITNNAEISAATNALNQNDEDSTPNSEDGNSAADGVDNDLAATDGSDDYDPATVAVEQIFDLALIETLAPGQSNLVRPGETVDLKVKVTNQGTLNASFIELTQYLPAGATLNMANLMGWMPINDSTALIQLTAGNGLPVGGLAPDSMVMLSLQVVLDENITAQEFVFHAEISEDGANNDIDSTPDDDRTNDAGGEVNTATDDVVDQTPPTDEDDEDPTMVMVEYFDLALTTEITTTGAIMSGDSVTAKIKVFNQGEIPADSIRVYAYTTDSLIVNDPNWVVVNDSVAYTLLTIADGELPVGGLLPDSMTMVTIGLMVDPAYTGTALTVVGEIGSATDQNGEPVRDQDSTPDSTNNDTVGGDNLTDSSNGDEDDHDPASITIGQIFDLALTKVLVGNNTYLPGDTATFRIYIYNQGAIAATSITVKDIIPADLILADADWTSNEYTFVGGLAVGAIDSVDIDLQIAPNFMGTSITNNAEISAATNDANQDDEDSMPNSEDGNSTPDGNDNDIAATDGSDDYDPATVTIGQIFDLALIEDLAPGQSVNIVPGDTADVKITVFNQGTLNADNITITQSLPAGVSLNTANLLGWTILNDSTVQITLTPGNGLPAGGLQPDSMVMVMLQIAIDENVRVDDLTLYAEISDDGANTDDDSTPNNDLTDDLGGVPNSATDNVTDGTNNDEDDHDPVFFNVRLYDLALNKILAAGQSTSARPEEMVSYTLWVYNQGNTEVSDININEYPATGLVYVDSLNIGWSIVNGDLRYNIAGPLAAGDSIAIDINLIVEPTFRGTVLQNIAEIQSFNEIGSVENIKDLDSTPANNNGTEDDQDNVSLTVIPNDFDLALTITAAPGQTTAINAGAEVETKVTIFNQGNVTADSIEITANIPVGMSLSTANANGWTQINDSTVVIVLTAADLTNGGIAPGQMQMIPLFLAVDAGFMGTSLTVRAEISNDGADNNDADSTPDNDFNNDIFGGDNITNNTGNDEDDHDPVTFTLTQTFDLALTKRLADSQLSGVLPGEVIQYTITVYNQGSLDAYDVDVVDYIPTDMSLVAIQGWSDLTATTAGQTIPFIAARDSASLNIFLQLAPTFAGTNITNNAEIAEASMTSGGPAAGDDDSTPDNIFGNDGTPINNAINNPADEDDSDYETIEVGTFDLALDKRLAATQTNIVSIGDDIDYEICITNEGNVDAYNISVVDRIPSGLALSTNDNNSWLPQSATSVYKVIAGPVTPGQTVCLNIKLTLNNGNPGADFVNVAEIFDQQDAQGNSIKDIDSTPDLEEENEELEEDDNGSAIVNLFACPDQVVASSVENICQGESVQLGVTTVTNLPVTYSWTPTSGLDDPFSATPVASPYVSTTYIVATTVAAEACIIYDTISVNVFDVPNPDFHANVACVGEPTIFDDETTTYTTLIGWFWDFGDGVGTSTEQNPSYTYQNAGHYIVKLITESTNGCRDSVWQEITVNPGAQAGAKGRQDTICVGECVELLAQGGTSFAWSPAATLNHTDCYNPIACPTETTTYYVDVTNDFGCTSRDSVTITVISGPTVAVEMSDISECGVFDGSITVNATGLASNYEYSIDGGLTYRSSNAFTGLPAASYLVVVKGGGCEVPYPNNPVIIGGPQSPRITAVPAVHPSCTADDGSITIEADGASNLVYSVNGGITWVPENVFTNLGGGIYYIAVASADLSCITYYPPVILVKPAAPVFTDVRTTNPSDCGVNDGTVSIIATGTEALEYGLSNGLMTVWQSSNNFINLPAGIYDVYVRNAGNTCETAYALNSIELADPAAPSLTAVQTTQPTDCGVDNALITMLSTPGSAPVEYSIDGGINWNNFAFYENLQPGIYNVFIRNQGGTCEVAYSNNPINISYPDAPTIVEVIHDQPQDCTTPDGRIEITAEGGTEDLIYSIDGGTTWQESSIFLGLSGGIYNVRVANSDESCIANYPTIELFDAIGGAIDGVTVDGNCGEGTGTISIEATSNTPLEYSIDNGATYQSSNNFFNLPNGDYNVLIRNVNDNCGVAYSNNPINVNYPDGATIVEVVQTQPQDCTTPDGRIEITAEGGADDLVYSIDAGGTWQASNVFLGLSGGIYNVRVANSDESCIANYPTIELFDAIGGTIDEVAVDGGCENGTGTISITATSNTSLEYSIDNGVTYQSSNNFFNLSNGDYNVLIRNVNDNCEIAYVNNPVEIGEGIIGGGISIGNIQTTEPTSCGGTDGTISIDATGENVVYSIDGGINFLATAEFDNLPAGEYNIFIKNTLTGCEVAYIFNPIQLVEPSQPIISTVEVTNPSDCNENDAVITIVADGDTGLQYSLDGSNWSNGNSFINLLPGLYNVWVRNDDESCAIPYANNPIVINAPTGPIITDCIGVNPTDCNVDDGTLMVIAAGGQGNLQYSIDGGTTWQASNIFTDLAAGIYSVAVANEDETCKAIHPLCELVAPQLPVLNEVAAVNPSICGEDNGSITILADGNGGLEYSIDGGNNWSGNSFFGNLAAGDYEVAVRNATDNCIVENGTITLDAPAAPTVVAGMENESTCTGNYLPVSITISENIAQYTILGSGGYLDANVAGATLTFDAYLNGVVSNFTVTLENADGCSVVEEFAIYQAADPEADFIVHNPTCAASDVTIEFTGEASPGAVLTWDVGSATIVSASAATATAPAGATLVVQWAIAGGKTISLDLNDGGCEDRKVQSVNINKSPFADAGADVTICDGECVQLNGLGNGAQYQWSPAIGLSATDVPNPMACPPVTTTYQLLVMGSEGCMVMDEVTVTVSGALTANAGPDQSICEGESIQLEATGGVSYKWTPSTGLSNPNIANPVATPQTITTYTVEVTNATGCVGRDAMVVRVNPAPIVEAGEEQMICVGENTMLSATGAISYEWSPANGLSSTNTPTPIASPTTTTTYTVIGTDINGCTATDQVRVIVGGNAQANAGADVEVCLGAATQLNASGGVIYSWTPTAGLNNPTIANPMASPNSTTTYTVTVTNLDGCIGTDEVTVSVNGFIAANAGADQTVCSGTPASLNATGGISYVWSPANGLNNPNIANPVATVTTTTTYTVTATNAEGCTATDEVTITVNDNAIANAGTDQTICNGSAALLNATGGVNYVWSPAAGLSNANIANPLASPNTTTVYTVSVTTADGCTATDQVTVTVRDNPIVNAGADQTICNGSAALLNATGGVNYVWSPATGLSNANIANPVATPNTTMAYTVSVTTADGCTATDQVTVTVRDNPIVNAGADQTICLGKIAFLNATGGVNYTWSPAIALNNSTIANPLANPTTTTTYCVTVTTADGCTSQDCVTVNVNTNCDTDGDGIADHLEDQNGNGIVDFGESDPNDPCDPIGAVANAGADQTICNGTAAFLNATGGITYSWSPTFGLSNPNIANPVVTPISTTTYTVTVRDAKNCVATDQVTVTVGNGASTVNAGADQTVCSGSTVFFNATGGTTYSWSPANGLSNPNAPNPVATLNQTTTYTVTSTNAQGCTSADQITIFVNDNINVGITPNVSTCGSQPVALNATGGTTYSWSPAAGLSNPNIANPIANPTQTTTYCVTVTNAQGCIGTACTIVSVNPGPTVVGCPDKYICNGGSVRLTVNGGVSWVWSPSIGLDNPFSPAPNASPNVTTTYTVTGTDAFGCSSSDLVIVTVSGSATVSAGPDQTTCGGSTVQLAASGGVTYNWSPSFGLSNPNSANPTVTPLATTTYTVQVTTADGCVGTDEVTVFVNNGTQVNAGQDQTTCVGSSTTLNATGGSNYTWSPAIGLSNPNIANPIANPSVTTTYTVTSISGGNCTSSDQVTVFVTQPTEVVGCEDKTICPGGSIQLTVTTGASYLYSPTTGLSDPTSPTPFASPTQTTVYTVFVTDANGCVGSDEIVVFVSGDALASAGPDQTVCAGGTTQLAASGGVSYSWSPTFGLSNPNIANPTVSPIATTTYTVTVRTAGGCVDTDQVTVAVSNGATVNAGVDQSICAGESAFLNASGGVTYSWSPAIGLSNPNIANPVASPASTTIYNVTTTTANGCVGNDQVTVAVTGAPTVNPSVTNPGCCNDNGSISLAVFGGSGNFTYGWSPNVSTSSSANNLPAGNYKIVITDRMGCDVIANVNLTQDCNNCVPISPEREVCVAQNATVGEICLPVRQADIGQYLITAAGQTINPNHGCNFENLTAYAYSLLQGAGNSGPYKIDNWTVNGAMYTTMVNNMTELANWMNSVDPSGNWTVDANVLIIRGGNPASTYGDMKIVHQVTWVETMLNPNVTGVATGTLVEVPMGNASELIVTIRNISTCCEETVLLKRCFDATPPPTCTEEIVAMQQITVTTTDCNVGGQVCVEIPLENVLDYSITVNGANYTGGYTGCNFDTLYAYTYFTMPDRGANGPYQLRSWSVNGQTYTGQFNNLTALINLMNAWDPNGNWFQDASTLTLQGGVAASTYGMMDIEQLNTGAFAILELNSNLVPMGTMLTFNAGVNQVTVSNNFTLCEDSFTATVLCNGGKPECEDFIASNSQQYRITTCDEAIGFCIEIPRSELGNYSIDHNGEMYTGAIDKCESDANNIQLYAGEGKHVFTFTNELTGCEDQIVIKVNCLQIGGSKTPIADNGISIVKTTATPSVDKSNGVGLPTVTDSETTTMVNESSIINVVSEDRAAAAEVTINILEAPKYGIVTINTDNTVTYEPATDYCDAQTPDFFRYELCNGQGCEEAKVTVTVECAPIKVFNAISPNRDGINDYFKVEGLEAYPENELKIYSRFGNLLYEKANYDNSWGGEVDGDILPNGTYFYILSDGKGKQHSGFINIQR